MIDLIRKTRGDNLELKGQDFKDCKQDIKSEAIKYLFGARLDINIRL